MTSDGSRPADSGGGRAEQDRYLRIRSLRPGRADSVPTLLAHLGDPSFRVRRAALSALRLFRDDATLVPALVAGLAASSNAGLRNACAEALVQVGGPAVACLRATAGTPDPNHRKFVVDVLGGIGTSEAREGVVPLLKDKDDNVRAAAAEALGLIGDPPSVAVLRRELETVGDNLLGRVHILSALARSGTVLPYEELAVYLAEPALARETYALLGLCRDGRAVAPLIVGVTVGARASRSVAVRALVNLLPLISERETGEVIAAMAPGSAGRAAVVALLRDEEEGVVSAAVRLLGSTGNPTLAPAIVAACARGPVVELGTKVVLGLGPAAIKPLLDAFDNADNESRVLAIEIVEMLGEASAVDTLLEIAAGPDNRAAEAAVRAVGRLASAEVIGRLMTLAIRRDDELAYAAGLALAALGGRHPLEVAAAMRRALEAGDTRPTWLLVLGALAREEDADLVAAAMHHRDPPVRCAGVEAARAFGSRFDDAHVALMLADEQPGVRVAAARALSTCGSAVALEALLAAAHDTDSWVVSEALKGLANSRDARATKTLFAAAESSTSLVVIAAIQSLFRVNPPGLAAVVDRALSHEDPEVVREGIALSMRLAVDQASPLLIRALHSRFWQVRSAAAEMAVNRGIDVPQDLVQWLLVAEHEPLAQEALERLVRAEGTEA